jgi:hypothetical protein
VIPFPTGDRAGAVVDPKARRRGLRSVRTRPKRSARGQSSSAMRLNSLSLSEAVAVSSAVAFCGWRTWIEKQSIVKRGGECMHVQE